MLPRQLAAHRHPRFEGCLSGENAAGPSEVDLLENTERRRWWVVQQCRTQTGVIEAENLTRLDVPHEFCADGVERAALGGGQPMVVSPAEAERAQAKRIAHGEHGVTGEDR